MSETICPDCGERNAGRVEFCSACGAFLAWDGPEEAPAQPGPSRPAPTAAPAVGGPATTPTPGAPPGQRADRQWRPTQPVPPQGQPMTRAYNPAAPMVGAPPVGAPPVGAQLQGPPTGSHHQGPPPGSHHQGPRTGSYRQGSPTGSHRQGPPPQPVYAPPPELAPPTESPCPRCGVVNDAALRFCRKCGLALKGPVLHGGGAARPQSPPERIPWWRRWFRPGDNTRRAARAAYRHSLPLRYRLVRYLLALLGIGAIVGTLTLLGQNPVGWVSNRIADLQGSLAQVSDLQAYSEPEITGTPSTSGSGTPRPTVPGSSAAPLAADTAGNVLDNLSDTAWSTAWAAAFQTNPAGARCVSPSTPSAAGAAGSILIVPSSTVTVREISVAAGLAKDDARRMLQWRPKTLQLAFSDGQCQQITLQDEDGLQQIKIDPVATSQIRVSVVDAYQPVPDQPMDLVSISEIRLFERP